MAHVLLRKVGSGGLAIPDQTSPGVCPVDGPFPTACGWNVEGNLALSSLWLRGRKMKPRIISFATVLALSSTLAFGQSGGGGSGGGSGGGAGGGSGGSSGSSGVGSSVGSSIGGPSDVNTSGALGRGATEPLRQTRTDRSNTNLGPSDPRIGQNSRNARASINKLHRHSGGLRSPISRIRK